MPIKAIFAPGQTEITVNGLHQWDYGQKLEIYSADLPTVVEVHFACVGMEAAVVRACEVTTDKAEVAIPDTCLEQTTPITAWLYVINGTTGSTVKTIIMPIKARTKPSDGGDIPEDISNRYTELITAANGIEARCSEMLAEAEEAVADIKEGNIVAKTATNASHATTADTATNANHATTADKATNANHATTADTATNAGHATTADTATNLAIKEMTALTPANTSKSEFSLETEAGEMYVLVAQYMGNQSATMLLCVPPDNPSYSTCSTTKAGSNFSGTYYKSRNSISIFDGNGNSYGLDYLYCRKL